MTAISGADSISAKIARLSAKSADGYYNPYTKFEWPTELEDDRFWMNPELLSVHGTPYGESLDELTLRRLSKWESINFYSLNVHGIREVLVEVSARLHTPKFTFATEFLHHFLGEENEHMWFFAKFCLDYGGKIYPEKKVRLGGGNPALDDFMLFARTVVFEEIVDYFNFRIGRNSGLHPIVQQINAVHHVDESRHVAFGRDIVRHLFAEIAGSEAVKSGQVADYLKRYMAHSIDLFYQPAVYADAKLPEPFKLRNVLRNHPARQAQHRKILARTTNFFVDAGILDSGEFDA